METNTSFNAGNGGRGKAGSHGWKGGKGKRGGGKSRRGKQSTPESFLEQPVANTVSSVPCKICGHPVDPKRMHFHMVRFHGAAMRSAPGPQG